MTEPTTFLLANLILLAAAILQAVAGFGFNLLASPLLVLLFPPAQTVPALLVGWLPLGLLLAATAWRQVSVRRVATLMGGALLGLPLGALALRGLPPAAMKVAIGVVTLLLAGLLSVGQGRRWQWERAGTVAVGFVSGALGGATGMSGPPLVLFGLNQSWESRGFRADMLAYFTLLSAAALPFYAPLGLLTPATMRLLLRLLPGLTLGLGFGIWLSRRASPQSFRRLALAILFIAGLLPIIVTLSSP